RLVDVSQDVIVSEYDCGTVKYIDAIPLVEGGDIIQSLRDRILGRVTAEDVRDPLSQEIIVQATSEITEDAAQKIEDAGIERVRIRSGLTCDTKRGICVMCYGRNLGNGRLAELGEAVGIIAAQSIGEPGTQLTMRTFHIGGTASRVVEGHADTGDRHRYPLPVGANINVPEGAEVFAADIIAKIPRETTKTKDITGGLPRVAELFEARKPKEQAVITEIDGRVEMGG